MGLREASGPAGGLGMAELSSLIDGWRDGASITDIRAHLDGLGIACDFKSLGKRVT